MDGEKVDYTRKSKDQMRKAKTGRAPSYQRAANADTHSALQHDTDSLLLLFAGTSTSGGETHEDLE